LHNNLQAILDSCFSNFETAYQEHLRNISMVPSCHYQAIRILEMLDAFQDL
jgi:hypothetical protein